MSFSFLFRDNVIAFDEKSENLNAQPFTLETVAMNFKNKKNVFWQKFKICYLRHLAEKRPTKFKPSPVGFSSFLQKDCYIHAQKVNESQYV